MHLIGKDSIVIGIDVHKYTHQAVALSCFGEELGKLQFSNDEIHQCITWLQTLGDKKHMLIGLEDTNGLGIHLTSQLQAAGFTLRYSPAVITERERKHSTSKDKNDYLDAKRVGKAILAKSEETLPAPHIVPQERIRLLDLLLQEREEVVRERTALKNQLHGLLHQYYGNAYRQTFADIFGKKARAWYVADLQQQEASSETLTDNRRFVAGSIVRRFERLAVIMKQADELLPLIEETGSHTPAVTKVASLLHGCGILTACKVVVEIGDIRRFETEAKLAKYAGIAPMQSQSGRRNRYYTNPFGNRKLNKAINAIALTQITPKGSVEGKTYFQKKVLEGKTKLWALRCLKRRVIRRIFTILSQSVMQTN